MIFFVSNLDFLKTLFIVTVTEGRVVMVKTVNNCGEHLYKSIAAEIKDQIHKGILIPGTALDSISKLQGRYGVARNTIIRVVDELEGEGIIRKHHGRGNFIRRTVIPRLCASCEFEPVEQVVLYILTANDTGSDYYAEYIDGVFERVKELSLGFRIEYQTRRSEHVLNPGVSLKVLPNEGVVTLYQGLSGHNLLKQLVVDGGFRCVAIDGVIEGATSVLTDNDYGMGCLVERLHALGHRRLAFVGRLSAPGCFFNVNERKEGFARHVSRLNMEGLIFPGTQYEDIFDLLKGGNGPTAVLFSQDIAAENCIQFLRENGVNVPVDVSICGFDDYINIGGASRSDFLTTLRIDKKEQGRRSVDTLVEMGVTTQTLNYWVRVKPRLVERNSIAKPNPEKV